MTTILRTYRERGANLLHWWLAELRGMLPAGLRDRLFSDRERVQIQVEADSRVTVIVQGLEARSERGSFDAGDPEESARFAGVVQAERKGRDLALVLPASGVLSRLVELPLAVEENLAQVLTFEMDRHTPFSAKQVYHGFRILERRPAQGRLRVRLLVVPRTVLDHWLERLAALGLRPEVVLAPADPYVNLLPRGSASGSRRGIPLNGVMAATTLVLGCAIVIAPLWYMRQVVVMLNHEVARMEDAARYAQLLQAQYDGLRQQAEFLVQRRQARPYAVQVLDELARVLPDHTWVQGLEMSRASVTVTGSSDSASGLIESIEASPVFEGVSFAAPVTKNPSTGADMFRISARVKEGR